MAYDLVPNRFWSFPTSRMLTSLLDDIDWEPVTQTGSDLSVYEDDKNVYIEAAVPGIDPEQVEVVFDKGVLWIKGEAKDEEDDKKNKYYYRANRQFSYRVAVPGEIDANADPEVDAKDGVVKVTFKKSPKAQPKKLSVKRK